MKYHIRGGGPLAIAYGLGVLDSCPEVSAVCGESGGAVAAAAWACGLAIYDIARAVGNEHGRFGTMRAALHRLLLLLLPFNCARRLIDAKVSVVVCRPVSLLVRKPLVVSDFKTKSHVIDVLLSSCHVPWAMNWNRRCPAGYIDGSFSNRAAMATIRGEADAVVYMGAPNLMSLCILPTKKQFLEKYEKGCLKG